MTNPNSAAQAAENDEVQRIKDRGPAYPHTPDAAPPTPLSKLRAPVPDERAAVDPCGYVAVKVSAVDWLKDKFPALTIKAGLCERIGGRLYTITRLMRDHDTALASAPVAGEALNDLQALQWAEKYGIQWALHTPDAIREVIADAQRLAAPQASAENVRNAALEEAAKLMDQTLRSNGATLIRGLKRSQADKDGGQQPNWIIDWSAAIKSLPMGRSEAAVDKSPNLQGSSVDRSEDLQGGGDDVVLPPLPSPPVHRGHALFAGSQMQTYARAAVLADRQQRAGDDLPAFMQSRMTPWGLLVRAGRIILGTTLMDMSKALGMRPSELSAYECDRQRLTDDVILAVMRFFDERGLCIPATAWRKAALSAPQAEQGERDEG